MRISFSQRDALPSATSSAFVVSRCGCRDQIRKQIPLEIAKQAREQIKVQIQDVLPVPLQAQAQEGRMHLAEVKHALENSYVPFRLFLRYAASDSNPGPMFREARRKNSVIRPSPNNMGDDLAVVVRPNGTRSKLYPANLRSLFVYDRAFLHSECPKPVLRC